ncbi:MAG: hypothetical protein ACTSYB_03470 [Candidatus Helarchaeota archaeon]
MVEWTTGTKLAVIAGGLAVLGSVLAWWSISESVMGMTITINFNPLFGISVMGMTISPPIQYILCGLLAIAGGALIFATLKKSIYGLVGGILALSGPILFMILWQIELSQGASELATLGIPAMGLFGISSFEMYGETVYLTYYVSYGAFMVIAGGILGIIASRKIEIFNDYA